MKKIKFIELSFFILMGTLITPSASAQSIKVGGILPLTGKLARFGTIERNSFLMGLDEINAAGGIRGKNIQLIIEDSACIGHVGRSAIEKLRSRDRVLAVIGGYCSSVAFAAAAAAQQFKVPFLVNTASADKISEQNWDYVFRLNPPASEYSKPLISFLTEVVKPKRVAILHENSLFGQSASMRFLRDFEETGTQMLMRESYGIGKPDFRPLLKEIKVKEPDLVFMISYWPDAVLLLRQSRELSLNPKLFGGGALSFTLPEFQQNAQDLAEYVCSGTLWAPSVPYPGAKEYYDKFLARHGSPTDYHGAQAYAAMYVIADALRRARSMTPEDVRDALAETNMMTVFGPVKFVSYGKKTRQNRPPVFLAQWIKGKLELIWPKKFATSNYVYPIPTWNER